ncbi:MAG: hypothetical protein ACOY0T_09545 [Myxococcota bacterium]
MGDGASKFSALAWLRGVLSAECTLDPHEGAVMLCIIKHCDHQGRAFPGLGLLSKETRVKRTKVVWAVAELEARGLLVRARQTKGAGLGSNVYTVPNEPAGSALGGLPRIDRSRKTSAPDGLGSAPDGLGVVRQAAFGSAPGAPYLDQLTDPSTASVSGALAPLAAPATPERPKNPRASKGKGQKRTQSWKQVPTWWAGPTEEHRKIAVEEGRDVDREAKCFRDHEFQRAKKDPDAAFSNWLRSPYGRNNGQARPSKGPHVQSGTHPDARGGQPSWLDDEPEQQSLGGVK